MNGVINFFKPKGITSHDAVYFFRKLLNIKRIGHAGTLDPSASGVLPICIGKATRISEYLMEADKEYISEINLGIETDTQDIDGKVLNYSDKVISSDEITNVFLKFQGEIEQIPPMYSALKYKGKKLYELARENIIVERKPRNANIKEIRILNNQDNKRILFYTHCSKGTYIRTLCHDIGNKIGTYGHMSYLMRVGVGEFKIEESLSMDYLKSLSIEKIESRILPIDMALNKLDKITIIDNEYKRVTSGVQIEINNKEKYRTNEEFRIYCKGKFIGIGTIFIRSNQQYLKMNKVFV